MSEREIIHHDIYDHISQQTKAEMDVFPWYTYTVSLEQQIEGLLFYKVDPIEKKQLMEFFAVDADTLTAALEALHLRLSSGGTRLLITDTSVQLVTAPELSEMIELLQRNELKKDIGKAGAETLSIILYKGPISRIEIDSIRGVNSNFVLRNLLVRGLVEKRQHPRDQRTSLYAITPELLAHLGVTQREELPQFEEIMNELDTYERERQQTTSQSESLS